MWSWLPPDYVLMRLLGILLFLVGLGIVVATPKLRDNLGLLWVRFLDALIARWSESKRGLRRLGRR
jgi:hypothetical protein